MQTTPTPRDLRLSHRSRLTAADLETLAHDPYGDHDPTPQTYHSLPRKITQEEAEERLVLEDRQFATWMDRCADVSGWRVAA